MKKEQMFNYNKQKIVYVGKGGLGFTGTLTFIFIILKLINVIDWSWIWVLSPLWISGLMYIGFIIILMIITILLTKKFR